MAKQSGAIQNIPDKLAGWCVIGPTDEEIDANFGVFNQWEK